MTYSTYKVRHTILDVYFNVTLNYMYTMYDLPRTLYSGWLLPSMYGADVLRTWIRRMKYMHTAYDADVNSVRCTCVQHTIYMCTGFKNNYLGNWKLPWLTLQVRRELSLPFFQIWSHYWIMYSTMAKYILYSIKVGKIVYYLGSLHRMENMFLKHISY
jgi:hypothetical protein